jgi:hypothetical protein
LAGTIEMFEGVDKPETAEELLPPHAVIKLREIIISNFFIKIFNFITNIIYVLFILFNIL